MRATVVVACRGDLTTPRTVFGAWIFAALLGCAEKPLPPVYVAPHPVASPIPMALKVGVLPPDMLMFSDVASALSDRLAHARVSGAEPAMMAKVSMQVAQISLECVSSTEDCFAKVGRFLQVDRLLWGQIERDKDAGLKVSVAFLDVGRGAMVGHAERVFPEATAAISGLQGLVDEVVSASPGPFTIGAPAMTTATCGLCAATSARVGLRRAGGVRALRREGRGVARAGRGRAAPRSAPPSAVAASPAPPSRRAATSEAPVDPRRTQAFASALASNADRVTPVRAFSASAGGGSQGGGRRGAKGSRRHRLVGRRLARRRGGRVARRARSARSGGARRIDAARPPGGRARGGSARGGRASGRARRRHGRDRRRDGADHLRPGPERARSARARRVHARARARHAGRRGGRAGRSVASCPPVTSAASRPIRRRWWPRLATPTSSFRMATLCRWSRNPCSRSMPARARVSPRSGDACLSAALA